MKKSVLFFLALFSLMLMGFDESELENRAPVDTDKFAEENYRDFILEIVNSSNAATFNFKKDDQDVTIRRVIPENRLVIDSQLNITIETPGEWIVPVYQSGSVKNAIVISESSEGKYEIVSIGYHYWLAYNISHMEEDEFYLHNMQYDLEFAYSPSNNRIRPLGDSSIRHFEENGLDLNGITKTEFVAFVKEHLKNNYPDRFNEKVESSYIYI